MGQCTVPLLVHLLTTDCKLLLQKIGENRNARLLPLSVGSIAQLHDCDREYSRLSICVPPTSAPPNFTVKLPNQDPSLGSLPSSHTPPPSSTELWGRCHWGLPPTTASFVSSSPPHPPISPCTPRCSAPGPQGRPAGCSPFPHSAQFWTFWTLPPFQLCSLGGLGATIVRRGSVRQGVTSQQRTTRGALTTSTQKPKKPCSSVPGVPRPLAKPFASLYIPPLPLPSLTPGILSSWLWLARINWAVYSVEKALPPLRPTHHLDDDILLGLQFTSGSLLGNLNHVE